MHYRNKILFLDAYFLFQKYFSFVTGNVIFSSVKKGDLETLKVLLTTKEEKNPIILKDKNFDDFDDSDGSIWLVRCWRLLSVLEF